jgi:hypothetical protein
MLFVLVFVIFAVALPAMGEVWSHGENNVFARSRREVIVVVQPYLKRLESTVTEAKERLTWLAVLSLLARFAKLILDAIIRFINRFTGG